MRLLVATLLVLAWPAPAWASSTDPRIAYLSRQLRTGKDVRVRAQAALVLGQSEEPDALAPLCDGLLDGSEVVRGAAARALEELAELGGVPCLERARADRDASVQAAVKRALGKLVELRDRRPWLYIALRPVKLPPSMEQPLADLTEARLRRQLQQLGARWAPVDEPSASAKRVLAGQKLKGFTLVPELLEHGEKGLRMRVLCLSYPDERLLGQVEVKATGGRPADLVKALIPRAVAEVAGIFEESRN